MRAALRDDAGVAAEPGFDATPARQTEANRRSAGGARNITLDERSVKARVRIGQSDSESLRSITGSLQAAPFGRVRPGAQPYTSVQVVLDDVRVTKAGEAGGFFYEIYLGLPPGAELSRPERYRLGSFGPFEIAAARHHGHSARLVFPATQVLKNVPPAQLMEMTVSFVRVSGSAVLRGPAVTVGEMRVELSTDNVE
jgi:tyrosinase